MDREVYLAALNMMVNNVDAELKQLNGEDEPIYRNGRAGASTIQTLLQMKGQLVSTIARLRAGESLEAIFPEVPASHWR